MARSGVVTTIGPVEAPTGTVAVISVELFTVKVAGDPLNVTDDAPVASLTAISSSFTLLRYTAKDQSTADSPLPKRPAPPNSKVVAFCTFNSVSPVTAERTFMGCGTSALMISQYVGAS